MKNLEWLCVPLIMIALYGYLAVDSVWGKPKQNESVECIKAGGQWRRASGCGADYCERAQAVRE